LTDVLLWRIGDIQVNVIGHAAIAGKAKGQASFRAPFNRKSLPIRYWLACIVKHVEAELIQLYAGLRT
jgi:hypothetical protein